MTSSFDRWEKDPFFSAAEEVQESADRMESIYRTWIHAKRDTSGIWDCAELRRDLRTTLGTTKWQLEEFEKAVGSSYVNKSTNDARERHRDFITAMMSQISTIETSLKEAAILEGKPPLPWVRLDEGERDELALFLSGPQASAPKVNYRSNIKNEEAASVKSLDKVPPAGDSGKSSNSSERALLNSMNEQKVHGHRRIASAGCAVDVGAWKISISGDVTLETHSDEQPKMPPRKIPSFSGFLNTMESASKLKWPKNVYKKLKAVDHQDEADTALLEIPQFTKGIHACYEKSKSCLDNADECYDKQLYGWYGSMQRQLQRSQYQMQYSRPIRITIWASLLLCFIGTLVVKKATKLVGLYICIVLIIASFLFCWHFGPPKLNNDCHHPLKVRWLTFVCLHLHLH